MADRVDPLIQPSWRSIVLETLRANDPERHRQLKRHPDRLERFVDDLARTAEETYAGIAKRTQEKYGRLHAWKLSGIQEIVMEHVILGEIPRP